MKKFMAMVLIVVACMLLAGCGRKEQASTDLEPEGVETILTETILTENIITWDDVTTTW